MRLKTKKKPVRLVNTSALRITLSESAFARMRLNSLTTRAISGRSRRRGIFMHVDEAKNKWCCTHELERRRRVTQNIGKKECCEQGEEQ